MATLKVTNIKNESFAGDQLYLKTDGKIGIGTTSPANVLDVQAGTTNTAIVARSTDAKAQISLLDNATTSVGCVVLGAEGDELFLTSGSSGAEALRIDSTGKVGIGTTSPTSKLYVNGVSTSDVLTLRTADSNGNCVLNILSEGTTGNSRITFSDTAASTGGQSWISYSHNDGWLDFKAGGTSSFKIQGDNVTINNGDLIIGTAGHGINFSATADAGASASNIYEILDDYEEGYFTPNIQPVTSGSITWVGTADLLSYTKIGRIVHIKGMLEVDSVSSPTGITRGTLPFAQASLTDESERTSGVCIITGTNIAAGSYALYPNGGTDSYLEPIRIGNSADIERDVSSYLGAGDKLYFSYTYQASA